MQREGIDFVETCAPLAKFESITCLIVIAAYYGLKVEQEDVATAFLNPDVEEEIYIQVSKILKFRRSSRKAPLLFVSWKDFMLLSELRDSATMHLMKRCIVSTWILTLVHK